MYLHKKHKACGINSTRSYNEENTDLSHCQLLNTQDSAQCNKKCEIKKECILAKILYKENDIRHRSCLQKIDLKK